MKKYFFIATFLALIPLVSSAATDYFLKLDGVKGESTSATSGGSEGTLRASSTKPVEPVELEVELEVKAADDEVKKKGNVEYTWKVEEGEKMRLEDEGVGIFLGEDDGEEVSEEAKKELEDFLKDGAEAEGMPVEEVSLNFGKIKTKLKTEMKFLGIFPISGETEVEIEAEDRVKVKFPWWAFLASGKEDKEELGERVYTTLSNVLKTRHDTVKNSIQNIR